MCLCKKVICLISVICEVFGYNKQTNKQLWQLISNATLYTYTKVNAHVLFKRQSIRQIAKHWIGELVL